MGGAGVGKNYMVAHDPVLKNYNLVDVDAIKKDAGKDAVKVMRDTLEGLFKKGENVVNTTIGGTVVGNVNKIKQALAHGYHVHIIYLRGDSSRGVANNALRAAGGGHDVPEYKIHATYDKASKAFEEIAKAATSSEIRDVK